APHVPYTTLFRSDARDVRGRARRLLDHLGEIGAEPVVRHAALHGHAERRHGGELHGVVGRLEDRLGEVLAHFARIDVEGGGELDVADVVTTAPRVQEPGDDPVVRRLTIVVDALD